MFEISKHFSGYDIFFTPYYSDGMIEILRKLDILNFTILGGSFKQQTLNFLDSKKLKIDLNGSRKNYDLVFTCADLIVPKNIRKSKLILVQEGMTDPENMIYHLVRYFKLPRYLASTSTQGLSNLYDKFCVASDGYKEFFLRKGVLEEKIVVTGIPNFDNCNSFLNNNFPFKNFVLVATSDSRETFKYENRKKFILKALRIANGRRLIFKLHPNENFKRAISEIHKYAPEALVLTEGNINEMIAKSDVLITKYSTVVYIGLALGKEVYSDFDLEQLKKLVPIQNHGTSAQKIAEVGYDLLDHSKNSPIEDYELIFQQA